MSNLATETTADYGAVIKKCFLNAYKSIYSGKTSVTAKDFAVWIKQLIDNNVSEKSIDTACEKAIKIKSSGGKHVGVDELIASCILIEANSKKLTANENSVGENSDDDNASFMDAFIAFSEKMRFKYRSLWLDHNKMNDAEVNFWVNDLESAGVRPENLNGIYDEIRKEPEFIQYPPNIDQVIDIHYRILLGEDLPSPSKAYLEAVSRNASSHSIVRYCRNEYGYHELKTQPANISKPAFERIYRDAIRKYAMGLLTFKNVPIKKDLHIINKSSTILSTIEEMLEKYK